MGWALSVQPTHALKRRTLQSSNDGYRNRDCTGVLLDLSVWYFDSKTLTKNNSHSNISLSMSKNNVS